MYAISCYTGPRYNSTQLYITCTYLLTEWRALIIRRAIVSLFIALTLNKDFLSHPYLIYLVNTIGDCCWWPVSLHFLRSNNTDLVFPKYFDFRTRRLIFSTLRPRQDGHHFEDDNVRCIFLYEDIWISINISLKCIPKGQINNIPALVQIMAWRRPGDKPLSEPMMFSLLIYIYIYMGHSASMS